MLLKKFDLVSPPITLFFEGETRHSSVVSGIITIAYFFSIAFIAAYYFSQVFFKTKTIGYYFPRRLNYTGKYEIGPNGVFHFLTIKERFYIDSTKIKIIGITTSPSGLMNLPEGQIDAALHFDYWEYESCSKYKNLIKIQGRKNEKEYFNSFTIFSLCITKFYNHTTNSSYTLGEEGFVYPFIENGDWPAGSSNYGIYILKNYNYDPEYFSSLDTYTIHFIDSYVDIFDFKNPFFSFFYNVSSMISISNQFTINYLNLSPLIVKSHLGYFIDRIAVKQNYLFHDVDKVKYSNQKRDDILGSCFFHMKSRAQIFERYYRKIPEALSRIGGMTKVLTTIAFILNKLYNDYIVIADLNRVFEVDSNQNAFRKRGTIINLGNMKPTLRIKSEKVNGNWKKKAKLSFMGSLFHRFKLKYNRVMAWIIEYRTRILSEEKIFKMYLVLKFMRKNWGGDTMISKRRLKGATLSSTYYQHFNNVNTSINSNLEFDNGVLVLK